MHTCMQEYGYMYKLYIVLTPSIHMTLIQALNKTFQFDSGDLGCLPDDRKFEDGMMLAEYCSYMYIK